MTLLFLIVPLGELKLSDEAVHSQVLVLGRNFLETIDDTIICAIVLYFEGHALPGFVLFHLKQVHESVSLLLVLQLLGRVLSQSDWR